MIIISSSKGLVVAEDGTMLKLDSAPKMRQRVAGDDSETTSRRTLSRSSARPLLITPTLAYTASCTARDSLLFTLVLPNSLGELGRSPGTVITVLEYRFRHFIGNDFCRLTRTVCGGEDRIQPFRN